MASTIGPLAYYQSDGTTKTKSEEMNSNISSTTGNKTTGSSTLDVDEFLQLLVAEMQYQDPLEPTDNTQYMAQLATFTQVEATTQMQISAEKDMASNLVGKTVIMSTELNSYGYVAGKVNYWENIDGTIYLGIGDKLYDIADLETVMDDDYYNQWVDGSDGTGDKDDAGDTDGVGDKDDTDGTGGAGDVDDTEDTGDVGDSDGTEDVGGSEDTEGTDDSEDTKD